MDKNFQKYRLKSVLPSNIRRLLVRGVFPLRFDGWIRIYLTLRCNLKCKYCVNEFWQEYDKKKSYALLSADQWIEIINRAGKNVILTGGEPFLYTDLIRLINGVDPKLKIKIYTNFTCDTERFAHEVQRSVEFYGSYHLCSGDPEKFIRHINILRDADKFDGVIHAIVTKNQSKTLKELIPSFRAHGLHLAFDYDQYDLFDGSSKKFRKSVVCKREIILIAPDGTRYPCVSKMVRKTDGMENLVHEQLQDNWIVSKCSDYGYCAPCDGLGVKEIQVISGS